MMLKTAIVIFCAAVIGFQVNDSPVVKITNPSAGSSIKWNTPVRYSVSVSDKEDGDTKYDEIVPNEVLLEVQLLSDTTADIKPRNIKGLQAMMKSNCMNCHAFDSKLIGPSFNDIANKYSNSSVDQLVKSVRDGSRGVWGDIPMPTHHELSVDETQLMVEWILGRKTDKDATYYLGTEGSLRIAKPAGDYKYVQLTASYLDKGGSVGQARIITKLID